MRRSDSAREEQFSFQVLVFPEHPCVCAGFTAVGTPNALYICYDVSVYHVSFPEIQPLLVMFLVLWGAVEGPSPGAHLDPTPGLDSQPKVRHLSSQLLHRHK